MQLDEEPVAIAPSAVVLYPTPALMREETGEGINQFCKIPESPRNRPQRDDHNLRRPPPPPLHGRPPG